MGGYFRNWSGQQPTGEARLRVLTPIFAMGAVFLSAAGMVNAQGLREGRIVAHEGSAAAANNSGITPALLLPSGVAYDSAGNLFFVDTRRNQVFGVSLAGQMTVIAGTGEQGFGGDGGSAASALFNAPTALAVGQDGTIYVADTGNQRVRAVSGGEVRTVAGTGVRGSASEGSLSAAAALRDPGELAVDTDGSLLFCDTGNHRVLRIKDGQVSTVAGSGVQGFSGDGGAAKAADLDTPSGVAVMKDGRVVIADAHNHRLRVVGKDGVIQTLAGTGVRGYSGDGGAAAAARLFLPRGVSVTAAGDLIFADSNNHRIRSLSSAGIITTIAGDGIQGVGTDAGLAGKTSLDTPRGAAASRFGTGTFADKLNPSVQEIAFDGRLYIVAAPLASRVSAVAVQVPSTLTYGEGTAAISVTTNAAAARGGVSVVEGGVTLGTASLTGSAVGVSLQGLSVGPHAITALYGGDGLNPAAASSPATITIGVRQAVATATAATMIYGSAPPQFSGSVTGILPQDAATVTASFSATAGGLVPVGSYPIAATLRGAGSGNYAVSMAPDSGVLKVEKAGSTVTLQSPAQTYAGLPLLLSASIGSVTSGVPTGEVDFLEGVTVVAKAAAANGSATGSYLAPASGSHQLTASYLGDGNFLGNVSVPFAVTVTAMPDFTLSTSATSTTVQAGRIGTYALNVAPSGGPFTGSVNFSISGLPAGAKASFSPSAVVPGANGAAVTLSIETPATLAADGQHPFSDQRSWLATAALLFTLWGRRRKRISQLLAAGLVAAFLLLCTGCGARTVGNGTAASRSFPLTVTATSTNLAGGVVTHNVSLTLTIQ